MIVDPYDSFVDHMIHSPSLWLITYSYDSLSILTPYSYFNSVDLGRSMILSVKGGVIQERDDSTRGMTPREDSGKIVAN